MSYARQLLDTYPRTLDVDTEGLAITIDALNDCAQACTADTAADLSERNVAEMVKCIRLCLDCSDICVATIGVTSRQTEYDAIVIKRGLDDLLRSLSRSPARPSFDSVPMARPHRPGREPRKAGSMDISGSGADGSLRGCTARSCTSQLLPPRW
jgi:hypothetical protein